MNEIVIYAKRGKQILYGILCFIFVAVSGLLLMGGLTDSGNDSLGLIIIGALGFTFFGLCFVYYVINTFRRKPALIVNQEGITDQSTYIGAGLVRWDEIANIDFVSFSGQTFLGIYTVDPDLIVDRSSSFKKMLNQMNKGLLDTQVNIPVKILDCSMDDLVETINNYWKQTEIAE
ncbi:STM3941 family protein [Paucisalibacillus globulus]|uniref:STM3941 family protein n=1 Tax=Paucisalibacillus globulus TaxID=351095 RepID=UPI000BB97ACF|nr:STM3941 family protein [Paucisalibacillus globulus]